MPVKHRKPFWVTVVLIAMAYSTVALLPIRKPRVDEQSLVRAIHRTDKPNLNRAQAAPFDTEVQCPSK